MTVHLDYIDGELYVICDTCHSQDGPFDYESVAEINAQRHTRSRLHVSNSRASYRFNL